MRREDQSSDKQRDIRSRGGEISPPCWMQDCRSETGSGQNHREVLGQKCHSHKDAKQDRIAASTIVDRSNEEMHGPGPKGEENRVGVILECEEGIEGCQQQERRSRKPFVAFGKVADEHPGAVEPETSIQHGKKDECPISPREHLEPESHDPSPEGRVLLIAKLKF